jgi:RNA processing factor Prp31
MNYNQHDTFMRDLENLSDEAEMMHEEDEDDIFASKKESSINDQGRNQVYQNNKLISSELSDSRKNENLKSKNKYLEEFLENSDQSQAMSSSGIKFFNDQKFTSLINEIDVFNSNNQISSKDSRLYYIISECNKYITDINQEINLIFKSLKESYSERFPELSSIILNPYDYATTVKNLGNNLDLSRVDLSYLPNNMQLSLNVVSSSTSGRPLNKEKLYQVQNLCEAIFNLNTYKRKILNFIESRMNIVCPNLSALVGSNIAAKLVTAAGGITELAKMPASNVLVMGAQRVNLEGFSTQGKLHMGYLSELDEVAKTPEKFKIQLLRKYAGKAVLMARVDAHRIIDTSNQINYVNFNNNKIQSNSQSKINTENNFKDYFSESEQGEKAQISENNQISQILTNSYEITGNQQINSNFPHSSQGLKLKEEISSKMSKIIEPQQAVSKKPLPRPDEKPRRKRGGKRARSIKEKYALTEMRMMKNRMKFGAEAEIEYRETGKGLGLLGVGGAGSKMKTVAKVQKINTKKQKMLSLESGQSQFIRGGAMTSTTSGLHSSVAFTPVEGIELINPELLEKKYSDVKEKYFSATSGFSTVINQKKKGSNTLYEI